MADVSTLGHLPARALSVRQPWAWAIVYAGKDVENRIRRAITLGSMEEFRHIAVHAASGMTREEYEDARDFMESIGVSCPRPDELVRGAVIGTVDVTGVTRTSDSRWFFGPWALELANAQPCETIPSLGALGMFDWRAHPVEAVREPLPWMLSWPQQAGRKVAAPAPEPDLFDGCGARA
jgi:hypothetical protein